MITNPIPLDNEQPGMGGRLNNPHQGISAKWRFQFVKLSDWLTSAESYKNEVLYEFNDTLTDVNIPRTRDWYLQAISLVCFR